MNSNRPSKKTIIFSVARALQHHHYERAGVYTTPLDISLTGAATDQEFDKFASSIKRDELPTTREVQDTNDFYRWKQFAIIAGSDAEVYKRRIENEFGHVLARRDDRVLIVTPEGVADDLQRLTPEIAAYKNLVAALDIQKLPSVAEAQGPAGATHRPQKGRSLRPVRRATFLLPRPARELGPDQRTVID